MSAAPRRLEAHGSAGAALAKLGDQIADCGAGALASIRVEVSAEVGQGTQPFRVLGHCVAQLARFKSHLKLDAVAEFDGVAGGAELRFNGEASVCVPLFENLYAALDDASDLSGSLTLTLTQAAAIDPGSADFNQFRQVLKRCGLSHITITAAFVDAR